MTQTANSSAIRVDKPWGHEEILLVVPGKYAVKDLHVNAGDRLSLQYHEHKDESMMLLTGQAYLLLGETLSTLEHVDLREGEFVHVPPGWVHRLCAITDTTVLEVSTTELDDVFRMSDDYTR